MSTFAHAIGFDDAPFDRAHRGDVTVIGVTMSDARVEGVLTTRIRRDGANATQRLATATTSSRFFAHLRLVLLQGIALGGFNVIDIHDLHARVGLPVLVVARKQPDLDRIRHALTTQVPGGLRKWRLIEKAGPMEPCSSVHVQRAGLSLDDAEAILHRFALHSTIPEPLRLAHIIGGGLILGESRGRA